MLRVNSVTLDHTVNYGSCLQAFALRQAICNQRIGGEFCDCRVVPIRLCDDYIATKSRYMAANSRFARLLRPILGYYRKPFERFENKYIVFANLPSLQDLPALNKTADCFVCGSDVIWNPRHNYGLGCYYLDFAEKYAFSYAASFGKLLTPEQESVLDERFKKLREIGVREASGAETAARHASVPVQVVADPVLLLDTKTWDAVAAKKKEKRPYIFVYATHLSDSLLSFVKKLKKQTGLPVKYAVSGPKQAVRFGVLQVFTPDRWLQLLRDADYVVTNSFHCTAFSVLYHRNFYTLVQGEKDSGINVRMFDFLKRASLEERLYNTVPAEIDFTSPDFTEADMFVAALRSNSLEFLRRNLEAAYLEKIERGE